MKHGNESFVHSTPALYDRYMGPLLMEPYAELVAKHCAKFRPVRILETAAGTGILTNALSRAVPDAVIVATDLNPAMLDFAAQRIRSERVKLERIDALALPYADMSFDATVCQFGIMFFPDKVKANREAWRVLSSGGHYLLVTFDQLARNPVPRAAGRAVNALFPERPLEYLQLGPFSYSDPVRIREDLVAAGFTDVELHTCELSTRVTAREAALGLVLGSPLRSQIEQRDPSALDRAVDAVTEALREWDGKDAPIAAHLAIARR